MANRLDYVRILVSSTKMNFIDEQMRLQVMGVEYSLRVVEDRSLEVFTVAD